jgi:uncharacterized repeat protein (TIGR01451 family)
MPAGADIHDVDTTTEIQNALIISNSNDEADTINIAAGTYTMNIPPFNYIASSSEDYDLTIVGAGAGQTIFDGEDTFQIMRVDTTGAGSDANTTISISGISFINGNNTGVGDENGGGLWVNTNAASVTIDSCEFIDNFSADDGGGLGLDGDAASVTSVITVRNSVFRGNRADSFGPNGGGANVDLDGATGVITGNTFENNTVGDDSLGGGLWIGDNAGLIPAASPATITGNTFRNNSAALGGFGGEGGGLYIDHLGVIDLSGNTFDGNTSTDDGGGALIDFNGIDGGTITNNIFTANTTADEGGGLLTVDSGTLTIDGNQFTDNQADSEGGGAYIDDITDTLVVSNNSFTRNSAGDDGGGLRVRADDPSEVRLINNLFDSNSAADPGNPGGAEGGGFDLIGDGIVIVDGNVVINNTADQDGGGGVIDGWDTTATVINNIFLNNSATGTPPSDGDGGGLEIEDADSPDATINVINNTFYGNTGVDGGGMKVDLDTGDTANFYNNIAFMNTGTNGADLYLQDDDDGDDIGGTVVADFNNIGDAASECDRDMIAPLCVSDITFGTNNIDPAVDPMLVDAVNGDGHLQGTSPMIDAGDNAAPAIPMTDVDGDMRMIDGNGDMNAVVDIGADEFVPAGGGPAMADLAVTKSASPSPVTVGQTVTYTIVVTNNGPDAATGVSAVDTLPAGVAFSSASAGCMEVAGIVTCDVGNLASGAMQMIQVMVTAPSTEMMITNSVTVTGNEADPTGANNDASTTTNVEVSPGPAPGGGGGGAAPAGGPGDNFFGCSLGSGDGPVDPTLPILLLVALMFLTRRGWMRVRLF